MVYFQQFFNNLRSKWKCETIMQPNTPIATGSVAAQRVVPLLQALNRAEENVAALALRLDAITNHITTADSKTLGSPTTVTGRLNNLGDTLQYLLDNIEL